MKKDRFVTLDGLRGGAAISVFIFHLFQHNTVFKDHNWFPSAYLAVDFFFLLSGFVIAKAYEQSLLDGRTFFEFAKIRLIRLYPLIFLGMMIGFLTLFDKILRHRILPYNQTVEELYEELILGLLLVPSFLSKVNPQLYPLNNPTWSLFYELAVNFLWALSLPVLNKKRLGVIVCLFGIIVVYVAHRHDGINVGYVTNEWKDGFVRAAFSFSLGILVCKIYDRGHFSFVPSISGFWPASILISSFLFGNFLHQSVYDLFCLFVLYPTILVVGSLAHLSAKSRSPTHKPHPDSC